MTTRDAADRSAEAPGSAVSEESAVSAVSKESEESAER